MSSGQQAVRSPESRSEAVRASGSVLVTFEAAADPSAEPAPTFGRNARAVRARLGLTLDRLATETGLSKGHLSRFERGEKTLSIAALVRLARALDTSVSSLLGEPAAERAFHLVRAGDDTRREAPTADGGYTYAALSAPGGDASLHVFLVDLAADSVRCGEARHGGEEGFYVLAGSVEAEVGSERVTLGAGDFLQFSGSLPHRIRSVGGRSRLFIVVAGG